MQATKNASRVAAILATLWFGTIAGAVPGELDFQAYLTNADGSPVDTSINITFAAYTVDMGGVPIWNQTLTVPVDQGLFQVALSRRPVRHRDLDRVVRRRRGDAAATQTELGALRVQGRRRRDPGRPDGRDAEPVGRGRRARG